MCQEAETEMRKLRKDAYKKRLALSTSELLLLRRGLESYKERFYRPNNDQITIAVNDLLGRIIALESNERLKQK